MAAKRPGLGRGLDALLAGSQAVQEDGGSMVNTAAGDQLKVLPVDRVMRGSYQPRRHFDETALDELADSIKEQGVLQPIVVRQIGDTYEIIAGERRWRATQRAGLDEIPAVIKKLDDQAAAAAALIENIQRENLNPLEESQALQRLIEEFELTHQEAAQAVGRSRASVTNLLRLLELPKEVKQWVDEQQLSMGHARALLGLPAAQQTEAAKQVIARALSVRDTEKLVKQLLANQNSTANASAEKADPNIVALEKELTDKLMASVKVQHQKNGKGKLVVQYNSLDELDGILKHIK